MTTKGRIAVTALGVAAVLAVGGCVTVPTGPAVMALPGQYKPFDQFRADDVDCRNYAASMVGGTTQPANDAAAATAVGSALVGAAIGAAIGSVSGQAGQGAAIGAGSGLLVGSVAGSNQAWGSQYAIQQSYDSAYMQCMYGRGNQIPVRASGYGRPYGGYQYSPPPSQYSPPPGQYSAPPPPPRSQ